MDLVMIHDSMNHRSSTNFRDFKDNMLTHLTYFDSVIPFPLGEWTRMGKVVFALPTYE